MGAADIIPLIDGAPERHLVVGETVIAQDEADPALFVLISGTLEARRGDAVLAQIAEPGAIVGELSLLLGTPASADVVAVEPSVVRRIDDAGQLFRDVPEFGQHLAIMLARRLHRVTTFLGDLQDQFADRPGTLGLVPTVLSGLLDQEHQEFVLGSDREPDAPY